MPGTINPHQADAPISITYIGQNSSASDLTTYPFSSEALGADDPTKPVIVVFMGGTGARSVSSATLTVGSTVYTGRRIAASPAGSSLNTVEIWTFEGVVGATGTISVTWSGAQSRCAIAKYRLNNCSIWDAFHTAANDNGGSNATGIGVTLNIPEYGAAIAACAHGSATTITWTGVTEDSDFQFDSDTASSGQFTSAAAVSGKSISFVGGASNAVALAAASWR